MNILIVTNLYPLPWEPSRATFNKQQFDRLAELYQVRILVPVAWSDYWRNREALKKANTATIRYVCYWYTPKVMYTLFGMFMFYSIWWRYRDWIREATVDAVLGSWVFPDGYAAGRIAEKLNCPYFVKAHGSDINVLAQEEGRRQKIAQVCLGATGVVTVSKALQTKIMALGVAEERVQQIYNGVDQKRFFPVADAQQRAYFLFVGNLKKDKGVLDLVEAYAKYCKLGGNMALVFIGGGAMETAIKNRINTLKLQHRIEMRGILPHDQVAASMRESSAVVLPSYHEGVPNVLLEAAACGVPVLASSVGGIPEVVIDGETGVLIEAGSIEQLQQGLQAVSDRSKWNRKKITQQGEQFTWARNIQALSTLLKTSSREINVQYKGLQ